MHEMNPSAKQSSLRLLHAVLEPHKPSHLSDAVEKNVGTTSEGARGRPYGGEDWLFLSRRSRSRWVVDRFSEVYSSSSSSSPACTGTLSERAQQQPRQTVTYIVASLLIFIALLVCFGFGLVWLALFGTECLPSLTEDLSDLTWGVGAD